MSLPQKLLDLQMKWEAIHITYRDGTWYVSEYIDHSGCHDSPNTGGTLECAVDRALNEVSQCKYCHDLLPNKHISTCDDCEERFG